MERGTIRLEWISGMKHRNRPKADPCVDFLDLYSSHRELGPEIGENRECRRVWGEDSLDLVPTKHSGPELERDPITLDGRLDRLIEMSRCPRARLWGDLLGSAEIANPNLPELCPHAVNLLGLKTSFQPS
jgi:hypothetical protein